jgi:hypothetical protein
MTIVKLVEKILLKEVFRKIHIQLLSELILKCVNLFSS